MGMPMSRGATSAGMAPSVNLSFDGPPQGVKRTRMGDMMSPIGAGSGNTFGGGDSSDIPRVSTQFVLNGSEKIGALIGKGGANIAQVRQISGATIKVDGDGGQMKVVNIEGTLGQVGSACS